MSNTNYFGREDYSYDINVERDLNGKTSFTIQLFLDCDHRKIQYYNEDTKNKLEINIKLKICPFPWRIFVYLYSYGDRIQLL
jgi:hypothetical protein